VIAEHRHGAQTRPKAGKRAREFYRARLNTGRVVTHHEVTGQDDQVRPQGIDLRDDLVQSPRAHHDVAHMDVAHQHDLDGRRAGGPIRQADHCRTHFGRGPGVQHPPAEQAEGAQQGESNADPEKAQATLRH
jgi:hypothetical protein